LPAASAPKPGSTVPILPKATIPLKSPATPGASLPKPKIASAEEEESDEQEETETNDGVLTILSAVGLAAAIVVLVTQLTVANVWINAEDSETAGQWLQILPF
jgi:hypothetical protein